MHGVKCAATASNQNLQVTYCGSVLSSRNVWALCPGKIQKCPNEVHDFFLLFQTLAQRLSTVELEKWAVVS